MTLTVGPARAEERVEAFQLLFGQVPDQERPARVDRGLELMASGEIAADGVIVCRDGDTLVGVMVALAMAGAAALIWPPQTGGGPQQQAIEDQLIDCTIAWLRQQGCKLVQALLGPDDAQAAHCLERRGFQRITNLHYLQKNLTPAGFEDAEPARLGCQEYTTCDPALFEATLLRSYLDTLDCPELNDLRTAGEVIDGYRAVPGCRLDQWWLAWQEDQPAGVLIVAQMQGMPAWELLYVGLVPEARGRGLGKELTCKALAAARAAGAERMTLTVDARNEPARRLYAALGFDEFDQRTVYLHILR
jgi:mycothiol synthase